MITLNLIPYKKRKELLKKRTDQFILFFTVISFFFLLIALVLLLLNSLLSKRITDVIEANVGVRDINLRSAKLNKDIRTINTIQDTYRFYTDLIVELTQVVPSTVEISRVSIDGINNVILIEGTALTLESLFQFRETMEASGKFKSAEFSTSDFLGATNTEFRMEATMNLLTL